MITSSLEKNQKLDRWTRIIGQRLLELTAILSIIFLYLPIIILVIYSFNESRLNAVWRGFTLKWYQSLFEGVAGQADIATQQIWNALFNSLWVGGISTLAATVMGTLIGLAMERFRFQGKSALEALLFLPIIIPDITMGISLLIFFSLLFQLIQTLTGVRLVLGLPTVIIGHIAFNISYVAVIVRTRIAELDPTLEEAALDLGANEWRTFYRITLPLIVPGIISGALLAFTLSLDDFVITFFTAGVGATTLPVFIYGMIKLSVTPAINAISTLMLVASLVILVSSLALQRQKT
ncbi:ABC transporter permease [Spirulina subsalsa FACHB-351]|uniref:ABC transporter permease n=1 Tax=Spirulina subsalsa FACHB-351 TaxID=234711 RepID=A0ABT3L658_9CYAN|nr:ABC transporter permease [Spirulina subsalsa]MCW6036475.1 ABC transporter permease [Spirulina subsalsa FACHB-351]